MKWRSRCITLLRMLYEMEEQVYHSAEDAVRNGGAGVSLC